MNKGIVKHAVYNNAKNEDTKSGGDMASGVRLPIVIKICSLLGESLALKSG